MTDSRDFVVLPFPWVADDRSKMRYQSLPIFIFALGLASCPGGGEQSTRAFIAPLHGQSDVPVAMELMLRTGGVSWPPNYPIPEGFIRVVDLQEGGLVNGIIYRSGDDILFKPSQPWEPNRRYSWTVDMVNSEPHGPEFYFPENLMGTAAFDTSNDLALLGASYEATEDQICMVFSRPLTANDAGELVISVDDVLIDDAVLELLTDEDWGKPYDLLPDDGGIGIMCLQTEVDVEVDDALRVWWGNDGPWHVRLRDSDIEQVVIDLRRGNW